MVYSPPSIDPSSRGDISGTIRLILTKFLQNNVDDMLPARVIAYDRATNRARVQPLIRVVTTLGDAVPRGEIASIPVMQLGGGGFVISFPINTGDLGWIKANDRDISLFLQSMAEANPNVGTLHSFEQGVFIPDTMMRQVVIDSEDADSVVLQSLNGTVRVALSDTAVTITAPEVNVNTPLATFSGNIYVVGDIVSNTVSLQGHTHGGVQTGSDDTGIPNI